MDAAAVQGLERIIEAISKPSSRRKFKENPKRVLEDLELDPKAFPREVLDAFAEMTAAELRLVSQLNSTLLEHGFVSDASGTVSIV